MVDGAAMPLSVTGDIDSTNQSELVAQVTAPFGG